MTRVYKADAKFESRQVIGVIPNGSVSDDVLIELGKNLRESTTEVSVIPSTMKARSVYKDKNGEFIFEGDRVMYNGNKYWVNFDGSSFFLIHLGDHIHLESLLPMPEIFINGYQSIPVLEVVKK